jgi:tetratricopeptide (TPR) repeat protein
MKMKFYLYLSLLFALAVSTPLSAQDKKESITKAPQENFKLQYKLKELAKDIQKTEKQVKTNQRENISAIESIRAKTTIINEQNKKLQKETTKVSSELDKVLNRKIFELKTRQEIIDYQGKKLNMWLTILAIVVTVLTVIIPIVFWIFSSKFEDRQTKLQEKIEKEQERIRGKSEELDKLIKTKEIKFDKLIGDKKKEFNILTNKLDAKLKSSGKKQSELVGQKAELFNKAYQASISKNYSEAINLYTELIKIDPENYIVYNNRGNAYFYQGDFSKAVDDHSEAIRLNDNYAEAYANRGAVYAREKRFQKAIEDYKKAIELKPDLINAHMNLIEILIITGDFIEANKCLEQIRTHKLSVHEESVISMLNVICALANKQDAKIELGKFKEILTGQISFAWEFEDFEDWLESPEFKQSAKIKTKIQDVIDRYKARQAELKAK